MKLPHIPAGRDQQGRQESGCRAAARTYPPLLPRLREFIAVYRLYRRHNHRTHALRSAWRIAVQGCPF